MKNQNTLQGKENFNTNYFSDIAEKMLETKGEILLMVRYPYTAGSKDYFLIKTKIEFQNIVKNLKARDALTIFKSYNTIKEGILDDKSIKELRKVIANQNSIDWLAVGISDDGTRWNCWVLDEEDFNGIIKEEKGDHIFIFNINEEPIWHDKKISTHAYIPDGDGIVRPGSY